MRHRLDRRLIVKGGLCAGLALTIGPAAAQDDPAALRPKAGDLLVRSDDATLKPLGADDLQVGGTQIMAWAMEPSEKVVRRGSRLNRIMLLRLDEGRLVGETKARAASGVVAYSAVCPHTGCDVTDWVPEEMAVLCPCHFSKFDPKDAATVLDGPAPRPLPSLPLRIADGLLIVAGSFSARVTFDPA